MLSTIFAAEVHDTGLAALGILIGGLITALTAALIKLKKASGEERREDVKLDQTNKITTFDQMQLVVRQLTDRVDKQDKILDEKDDRIKELSGEITECREDRSQLAERVAWLEQHAGKAIPSLSKEHKPLTDKPS